MLIYLHSQMETPLLYEHSKVSCQFQPKNNNNGHKCLFEKRLSSLCTGLASEDGQIWLVNTVAKLYLVLFIFDLAVKFRHDILAKEALRFLTILLTFNTFILLVLFATEKMTSTMINIIFCFILSRFLIYYMHSESEVLV